MQSKTILVTGGTGYIGSWIVKILLEKGYQVRLGSRNTKTKEKFAHLQKIALSTSGKLSIFEADLLVPGSYDEAAEGSDAIIHVASPFTLSFKDANKELIEPAVLGTQNVLNAATHSSSVKRIVLTSSTAAIIGDNKDMQDLGLQEYTEEHFNETSSPTHQPYSYSKVKAERAAWTLFNAQNKWSFVVMNPSFVMGPALSLNTKSESIKFMKDILRGKLFFGAPDLYFGIVDVRDVALAHIISLENESAKGRHILSQDVLSIRQMTDIIKKLYPNKYKLPFMTAPKTILYLFGWTFGVTPKFINRNVGYTIKLNSQKSKDKLGLKYRRAEDTFRDMISEL